jgi:hypothetical protein
MNTSEYLEGAAAFHAGKDYWLDNPYKDGFTAAELDKWHEWADGYEAAENGKG